MRTFFGVLTEFYNNGLVKACIISRKAKFKPENKFKHTPIADCYADWFETLAEAENTLKEARAA